MTLTQDQINDLARGLSVLVAEDVPNREGIAKAFFAPLIILGASDSDQSAVSSAAASLLKAYVEMAETTQPKTKL